MKKNWMERIALAVVTHYCLFLFLTKSSTFYFNFTELYRRITWISIVCTGTARLIQGLYDEIRTGGEKGKRAALIKSLVALASLIPCSILANRFGYVFFPYIPFVAFCLYGMKPEKVLKVFAACIGTVLMVTVLCALSGAIRNYLYPGYGRRGQIRAAYGTNYPTDFAAYILYLMVLWWCAQGKQGKQYTILFCLSGLFTAYMLYTYPHSETSTICSIVFAAVTLYTGITENSKREGTKRWLAVTDRLAIWAFPILCAVLWGLVILYASGFGPGEQINRMLSDRLNLILTAVRKYGIQAFGAWTPQSGWGGGLIKTTEYEFLDSTYALLPIRYGWVITILMGSLWVWTTRKAIRTGHRRIGYAMAIIALHSFSEHHFPELNYNILLAIPLCAFTMEAQQAEEAKKSIILRVCGAAGVVAALLLLPKALSWVRCVVTLEGWTGGGDNSMHAAFFWLGCIAVVALLAITLRRLPREIKTPEKPTMNALAGVFIAVCLAAGITLGVNDKINEGIAAFDGQLEAERPAIEAVLTNATEPVYVGQTEELYKRKFGRIADRIFTAEEIARSRKGSALLEQGNEGYQLMFTGAKYTELTPYTGLFTYDQELMDALGREGRRFDSRYSAEQEENLIAAATILGIPMEEGVLILRGEGNSLRNAIYLDQYGGDYRVTFTMELTGIDSEEDGNHEICEVKAQTLWGAETLAEKTLYEEDFGGSGKIEATLDYSTGNTKGIDYQVICRDGVEIRVKRISWKQRAAEE